MAYWQAWRQIIVWTAYLAGSSWTTLWAAEPLHFVETIPLPGVEGRIDHLAVEGAYANLEAIPLFKDGSYVDLQYLPDMGYIFCLRKEGAGWRVIVDLSRSDVPDAAEAQSLKRQLPADFPHGLLSPTWRRLLAN